MINAKTTQRPRSAPVAAKRIDQQMAQRWLRSRVRLAHERGEHTLAVSRRLAAALVDDDSPDGPRAA